MSEAALSYTDPSGNPQSLALAPGIVFSIGSGPNNQLVLQGADILPTQVQIQFDGQSWIFRTPSFRNPVVVNGQARAQGSLADGDQMQVGNHSLFFNLGGAGTAGSAGGENLVDLIPEPNEFSDDPNRIDIGNGEAGGIDARPSPSAIDLEQLNLAPMTEEMANPFQPPGPPAGAGAELEPPPPAPPIPDKPDLAPAPPAVPPSLRLEPGSGQSGMGLADSGVDSQYRLDTQSLFGEEPEPVPFEQADFEIQDTGAPETDPNLIGFSKEETFAPDTGDTGWEMDADYRQKVGRGAPPGATPAGAAPPAGATQPAGGGVRIVENAGQGADFVSLPPQAPGVPPMMRARPMAPRQPVDSKQLWAGVIVVAVLIASIVLVAVLLQEDKRPVQNTRSPVFNQMLEALSKGQDDKVIDLEEEFLDGPSTDKQKAGVEDMMQVVKFRKEAAHGDDVETVKKGELYLAGDARFGFAVLPVVQGALLRLGRKQLGAGEFDAAENYFKRAIKWKPESKEGLKAKDLLAAVAEGRAEAATAQVKAGAAEAFLKKASALLSAGNYQEIVKQYRKLTTEHPEAGRDESVQLVYVQAIKALEEEEVGTLQLAFVESGAKALKVPPEKWEPMAGVPVTHTLYKLEDEKLKILTGPALQPGENPPAAGALVIEAKGVYYGLDLSQGNIFWSRPAGGTERFRPVPLPLPNAPMHYLGFDAAARQLFVLSSFNGEELWRIQLQGVLNVPPSTDGRRVFIATEKEREGDWPPRLMVLDAFSGELLASADLDSPLSCPVARQTVGQGAQAREFLYVCTRNAHLYVLASETGKSVQGFKLKGVAEQPPLVVPPYVLIFQNTEEHCVISGAMAGPGGLDEHETWKDLLMKDRPGSLPRVDAAFVFVPGAKGRQYVLGVDVKDREKPLFWLVEDGSAQELGFPVYVQPVDDGKKILAAGAGARTFEFHQFDRGSRLKPDWTAAIKRPWPEFGQAMGPPRREAGRILVQARGPGDGTLLWSLDAASGDPLWCLSLGVGLGAPPVIDSQGRAFVHTNAGRLLLASFDNTTSKAEPRDYDVRPLSRFAARVARPVLASFDGTPVMFFGNRDGLFYALDASSGFSFWSDPFTSSGAITQAAASDGKLVYCPAGSSVFGLGLKDGALRYLYEEEDGSPFTTAPLLLNGSLILGNKNGKLYSLRPDEEGGEDFLKKQWEFKTDRAIGYSPSTDGNLVYLGGEDGTLYALNANGALVNRWKLGSPAVTGAIVHGHRVYVATANGQVQSFSLADGMPAWKTNLPDGQVPSTMVLTDYHVLVGTAAGLVFQVRNDNGSMVQTLRAGRHQIEGLATIQRRLIATSSDGYLYTLLMDAVP